MVFLPGDHTLDTNITVANVTGLTMRGESSSGNRATVVCSGSVGLSFTSMKEFKVDSLAFTFCSRNYSYPPNVVSYFTLLLQSTQYAELINCSFHDNLGTALVMNNTSAILAGNNFTHNQCQSSVCEGGGGVMALYSNLTFTGNTTFLDNSATSVYGGGAIYALRNAVLSFSGTNNLISNSADGDGGAIYASHDAVLNFNGNNNFINNSAVSGSSGGAIYASYNAEISFNGNSNFINNSAGGPGGAIYASHSTVLNFIGTNDFINNSVDNGGGGVICTNTNSTLLFNGTIYFTNNGHYGSGIDTLTTTDGGGVRIGLKCTFNILPNTTVYWNNNHATLGGAIYVDDVSPASYCAVVGGPQEECFFQLPGQNLSNAIDVQLIFKNNSADVAGSVLYGGVIDNCKLAHGLDSHSSGEVFNMIVHTDNETEDNTTSTISSDPLQICPCESSHPNCSKFEYHFPRTVYPGETFQVSVVAVGQRNGTVPSRVISILNNQGYLPNSQHLQQANNTCTKLNYTVLSLHQHVNIELHAEGSPCSIFGDKNELDILVDLNQTCPPGFNISESAGSCVCEPRLDHYTNNCTITNGIGNITREAGQKFWIGYDDQSQSDKLILYPLCPYSYCVNDNVSFPLNESDIQCANNRSGFLCGACKEGYSLVLGTSRCKKCTNSYLALLIPFAVMGVALVFLLLACKLTVATGTLGGLLFYANIVGINRTIFLPVESTDAVSVFIAWLNLDFGIETCFYNRMDAYTKTWLQFVFPLYIWMLVGLIIFLSHFLRRFANMLGNNPVSVLATLILLSYTKILRTLITALYITYLEYPTYNRMVWLYDANIDYLSGKHIPLFIVAVLVFLFLFLPYTLLLLFGQWLQAISHLRLFSWVNSARLIPFMHAYHAPYKAKHRYWPGLLLVLRFVLLLVFAFNPQQDPSVNLLAIVVGTGTLHLWAWISGGVYNNWFLDALEGSFALNLILLAAATTYIDHSQGNQLAVGYTSVSIAFATFIGILGFQLANVIGVSQYLERKCTTRNGETECDTDSLPHRVINPGEYDPVSQTTQEHTAAEPTGRNDEEPKRSIFAYTHSSHN